MKVVVYGVTFNNKPWPAGSAAIAEGLRGAGFQVIMSNGKYFNQGDIHPDASLVVTSGMQGNFGKVPLLYKPLGVPAIILDLGWMRRDMGYMQMSHNDLNSPLKGKYPSDRFEKLGINLASRPRGGKNIMIFGQKAHDAQHDLGGLEEIKNWCENVCDQVRSRTDRDVIIRPHPKTFFMSKVPDKLSDPKADKLDVALQKFDVGLAITYNSTSTLECLAAGVPVIALCKETMYDRLVNHDLDAVDSPMFPDVNETREFMSMLAYSQYTLDELAAYEPIEPVLYGIGVFK